MIGGLRRQRGLLLPGLVAFAAFVALIALGRWQLERRISKEVQIATLTDRLAAPPQPLPPPARRLVFEPPSEAFVRFSMRVQFLPGTEARVYSGGTALRDDIKGPGYFAFAPARLDDGSTVVINRGHVDNPNPDASLKPIALPETPLDIVGALRWPEQAGWFVAPYSERQDLWFARDHRAMAARYGWGEVAPFYVEMESPAPRGGVPRPARLAVNLRNDHFNYAMTWFGLAVVLAIAFGFWTRSRRRDASA